MEVIRLLNVQKQFAQRQLFSLPNLSVNRGDKIALVGANGQGKSTLLKILAGIDDDFQGQCRIRGEVAYLSQLKPSSQLSGGEQTKQELSQVFAQRADILLLDEPSANLDRQHLSWLIGQLKSYRGTLLLVSHDRYLINQLADTVWLLANQTITPYVGNYDAFEQTRATEKESHRRDYKAYRDKVDGLIKSATEKQAKAKKLTKRKKSVSSSEWKARSLAGSYDGQQKALARAAKSIEKRLEKLEVVQPLHDAKPLKLKEIGTHLPPGGKLIHLEENDLMIGDQFLCHYPEWLIKSGDKLVLSGRNGTGKTSFVKGLFHRTLPATYSPRLQVSYLSQDFKVLDLDKTALANLAETSSQDRGDLINFLTALGLSYDQVHQPLHHLSGGERVRVQLAKVLTADANLLILDEPTNYLDLPTLIALEEFLTTYPGAVILISHDQAFVENLSWKNYLIDQGELRAT